ncbi:MAG TPA: hypothetical protein PLL64_11265 [Rhodothermales bacterium]|nr:hypothetical protein [Rhodothermales bacterium]HRR09805.1 hypothetical protein [Rhodothermales bacterium]
MHKIRLIFVFFLILLNTGCDSGAEIVAGLGEWGSSQLALIVTQTGAIMEFGCATGTLDKPIKADKNGQFSVPGTYTPGSGVPPPEGYVPPVYPILVTGQISGQTMTVTITRADQQSEIGRFIVSKGTPAKLQKCPVRHV